MADSEKDTSAQTQTSAITASENTTPQQCTSVPANVVEAINKSNDFVPALFALPCDSGDKKLKLCKRVGWLRDGVFTTGYMEINVKEAKQKGIFNQPRRVTLVRKEDSLFQSAVVGTGSKAPSCDDLSAAMLKRQASTTAVIEVKGELIPNTITVGKDSVQTAETPGKLVALSSQASAPPETCGTGTVGKNADSDSSSGKKNVSEKPSEGGQKSTIDSSETSKVTKDCDNNNTPLPEERKQLQQTESSPKTTIDSVEGKPENRPTTEYFLTESGKASPMKNTNEPDSTTEFPDTPAVRTLQRLMHVADADRNGIDSKTTAPKASCAPRTHEEPRSTAVSARPTSTTRAGSKQSPALPVVSKARGVYAPKASVHDIVDRLVSKNLQKMAEARVIQPGTTSASDSKPLNSHSSPTFDIFKLDGDVSSSDTHRTEVMSPATVTSVTPPSCVQTVSRGNSDGQERTQTRKISHTCDTTTDEATLKSDGSEMNPGNPEVQPAATRGNNLNSNSSEPNQKGVIETVSVTKQPVVRAASPEDSPGLVVKKSTSDSTLEVPLSVASKANNAGDPSCPSTLPDDGTKARSQSSTEDCTTPRNQPNISRSSEGSAVLQQTSGIIQTAGTSDDDSFNLPKVYTVSMSASGSVVNLLPTPLPTTGDDQSVKLLRSDANPPLATDVVLPSVHCAREMQDRSPSHIQPEGDELNSAASDAKAASTTLSAAAPQDASTNSSPESPVGSDSLGVGNKTKSEDTQSPTPEENLPRKGPQVQPSESMNRGCKVPSPTPNSSPAKQPDTAQSSVDMNRGRTANNSLSDCVSENQPRDSSDGYPALQIGSVYSLSEKEAKQLFPKHHSPKQVCPIQIKQEPIDDYKYSNVPIPDDGADDNPTTDAETISTVTSKEGLPYIPRNSTHSNLKSQIQLPVSATASQPHQNAPASPFPNISNVKTYNVIPSKRTLAPGKIRSPVTTGAPAPQQNLTSSRFVVQIPSAGSINTHPSRMVITDPNKQLYTLFPSGVQVCQSQQPQLISLMPVQLGTPQGSTGKVISPSAASTQTTSAKSRKTPPTSSAKFLGERPSTPTASPSSKPQTPTVLNLPIVPQTPGNKRIVITKVTKEFSSGAQSAPAASVPVVGGARQTIPVPSSVISKMFTALNSSQSSRTVVSSAGIVSKPFSTNVQAISHGSSSTKNTIVVTGASVNTRTEAKVALNPKSSQTSGLALNPSKLTQIDVTLSEPKKTFLITTSNGEKRLVSLPSNADAAAILSQMASNKAYQFVVPQNTEQKKPQLSSEKHAKKEVDVSSGTQSISPKKAKKSHKSDRKEKKKLPVLKIKFKGTEAGQDVRRSSRERKLKRPYSPPRSASRSPKVPRVEDSSVAASDETTSSPSTQDGQEPFIKTEPASPDPEDAYPDDMWERADSPPVQPPSPPSYVNREDRVKRLKELMKEKERALEEILKRRQQEMEERLADPQLCDL